MDQYIEFGSTEHSEPKGLLHHSRTFPTLLNRRLDSRRKHKSSPVQIKLPQRTLTSVLSRVKAISDSYLQRGYETLISSSHLLLLPPPPPTPPLCTVAFSVIYLMTGKLKEKCKSAHKDRKNNGCLEMSPLDLSLRENERSLMASAIRDGAAV